MNRLKYKMIVSFQWYLTFLAFQPSKMKIPGMPYALKGSRPPCYQPLLQCILYRVNVTQRQNCSCML